MHTGSCVIIRCGSLRGAVQGWNDMVAKQLESGDNWDL